MRICWLSVFFVLVALALAQTHQSNAPKGPDNGNIPARGYVPDATTAVKVAEAVLIPIYGQDTVDSEHPLRAVLKDDIWTVELHPPVRRK